jgi:hypothetical protein
MIRIYVDSLIGRAGSHHAPANLTGTSARIPRIEIPDSLCSSGWASISRSYQQVPQCVAETLVRFVCWISHYYFYGSYYVIFNIAGKAKLILTLTLKLPLRSARCLIVSVLQHSYHLKLDVQRSRVPLRSARGIILSVLHYSYDLRLYVQPMASSRMQVVGTFRKRHFSSASLHK